MLGPIAGGDFSLALLNVVLLALWGVLPTLLLAYGRQSLLARRVRAEFSLHKSEATELDRALVLYGKVRSRLDEINERSQKPKGIWHVVFALQADVDQRDAEERDDLEAHARHLRATIIRLRRLPLRRLMTWVHIVSSRFALGHALAVHIEAFALLILALYFHGHPAWAHELGTATPSPLVWYPFDQRIFQANAGAACLAALLAPMFYLLRRISLRREYRLEFCLLTELADTGPDQNIREPQADCTDNDMSVEWNLAARSSDEGWFAILGVPQSATAQQVREAYRALVKQNHPDRVHDMSPAIRKFAETETKKLNAAYQDALATVS